MPVTENGIVVDAIFNPLAIVNREIPAVLFEHELNFCTDCIIEKLDKRKPKKAFGEFVDYIRMVNEQQAHFLEEFVSEPEYSDFLDEISEHGFPIHQPPFFDNINFEKLSEIYGRYEFIEPYKITYSSRPLIVADLYMLRLKHLNFNKFSTRSARNVSLKEVPIKSNTDYKMYKSLYSTNPVRFGEQEVLNLMLVKDVDALSGLIAGYSTNKNSREDLVEQLLTQDEPFGLVDIHFEGKSSVFKILEVYFKCIGIEIDTKTSN